MTSFIESVKQKELLTSVLAIVKVELPEVYAALIGTHVTCTSHVSYIIGALSGWFLWGPRKGLEYPDIVI